ncbi:hypothetical protein EB06_00525 [Enterococcus cecorum]|nr:hypothetical protein EB06_00525 [Enterococcus cecorum]
MDAFDFLVQMGLMGQPLFLYIQVKSVSTLLEETLFLYG